LGHDSLPGKRVKGYNRATVGRISIENWGFNVIRKKRGGGEQSSVKKRSGRIGGFGSPATAGGGTRATGLKGRGGKSRSDWGAGGQG